MTSKSQLVNDPKKRKIQETLLQYGIAENTARAVSLVELRCWAPAQLSKILTKVSKNGNHLKNFDSPTHNILSVSFKSTWLKPPLEFVEQSAKEGSALCVNEAGEWQLFTEGYFAISHVWEEGIQADPSNRGMPRALIEQIFRKIRLTGAKWIWLDGLAIPGASRSLTLHEEDLKIAIINNLARIYRQASAVLIFDALVMHLQSNDLIEVAVCLICGKWMTRVWTLQEAHLTKRALIMTASGYVELLNVARKLRALSGLSGHLSDIFGTDKNYLDDVPHTDKNSEKYEELYLALARLLANDGKKPSLASLAMMCNNRKTGNDIDYARAFFPLLGLTWKTRMTREEGMEVIYNSQRYFTKRLLLMNGSPRSALRPGWAPSYLTGLDGRPIGPDDPLGDVEWQRRGLKRKWYTYKVTAHHPTNKDNSLLLEVNDGSSGDILCGCQVSFNERAIALDGFRSSVAKNSAYMLSNNLISFPSSNGLGYNVMLVERNEEFRDENEAWVYLTAAVCAAQKNFSASASSWLLLHESPIGTDDRSGKMGSEIARMLSDEDALHKDGSSLHVAARTGDENKMQVLLGIHGDVDVRDERGWTPLHVAAYKGHVSIAELLLKNGAIVDAEDKSQRSPLMIAADEGHDDMVKKLLHQGAKVNISNQNALSPLNQALVRGHYTTIRILLEAGADPRGENNRGFAPLYLASGKDSQILDLLLAAGADPTESLAGGTTILHLAARQGNLSVVQRLLDLGVPVDSAEAGSETGNTPLLYAIEEQEEATVSFLLSCGADPNHKLKDTWTCSLRAAKVGNYEIMKMLVRGGADPQSVCSPEGWTALHVACREGHRRIVALLVDAKWSVDAKDANGHTPLEVARKAGRDSVVEALERVKRG